MTSFRFGFQNTYDRSREVYSMLSEEQLKRYSTNPDLYMSFAHDAVFHDELWTDANDGVPAALMVLGYVAREESGFLNRRTLDGTTDYKEAAPGYHDRPVLPEVDRRREITVEDFEIECLKAEIELAKLRAQRIKDEIVKPSKKKLKQKP